MTSPVDVSITGFRQRSAWAAPVFPWYAALALRQAARSGGNLAAEVRAADGGRHPLTVWRAREAMTACLRSGTQGRAAGHLGIGPACGTLRQGAPDWPGALALRDAHARDY